MTTSTFDIDMVLRPDNLAQSISDNYIRWRSAREVKEAQWAELRSYLFATDTTTTTNAKLPWKNKTTRPKLTQIRDNLQANYQAAVFPAERWFKWEPGNEEGATKEKIIAIEAFMRHKFKEGKFEQITAQLLNDFIDYGNCFAEVEYCNEQAIINGSPITVFSGPRLVRLSPLDIVFDVTASSFEQAPKITRTMLTFGQIEKLRRTNPDWKVLGEDLIAKIKDNRKELLRNPKVLEQGDAAKTKALTADGFNSLIDYYKSGYVEFLEFEGDMFDTETMELFENHVITVVDRLYVVRKMPINNWFGKSYKQHCGWRLRPDNLMAMGPLDNLVGLQYRLDHLENLKADVFDQIATPFIKVKGYVEDFEFGPMQRAYMEVDADIEAMQPDATALNADLEIARLEQTMEEMAGAPKQAMGVRTPGEKTAFEVGELMTAASRIFQNKTMYFEKNFLEPLMNSMLEIARRNLSQEEVVKVVDDELGIEEFLTIAPDDIKAKGTLVPMGARHFAAQSQLIQNLTQLSNTGIYQDPAVQMHFSSKKMAELIEQNLNLERFKLVRSFVRLEEQLEAQTLAQQAAEELDVNAITPTQTQSDLTTQPEAPPEEAPING